MKDLLSGACVVVNTVLNLEILCCHLVQTSIAFAIKYTVLYRSSCFLHCESFLFKRDGVEWSFSSKETTRGKG